MKKSYFERDMKNEQIITKWIERNFLMTVTDKYEIIQDSKIQNSGVDFIITSEKLFGYNLPYKVDFKAALNYIRPIRDEYNNRPQKMPTFAFELSFLNRLNEEREGWLYGEKYSNTEYFMLAWVWVDLPAKRNKKGYIAIDMNKFSYDCIEEIEIIILNKDVIRNYARSFGINEVTAITKSQEMRNKEIKEIFLVVGNKYPKLHYSHFLNEEPVNLVIHTNDLQELATYHETITKLPDENDVEIETKVDSSMEYTCQLFNNGYTVSEIMEERKLTHSTIINHLFRGSYEGFVKPTSSFLSEKKISAIQEAISHHGEERLSTIKYHLDEKLGADVVSYNQIKQYLIEQYSNSSEQK